MRKPKVKAGPGRSWVGPGPSWVGPGDFFDDFWRSGGPKKKFHFFKRNRMKLSGSNYRHLKTENLLLFHGSISEKLSLYRFFWLQIFFFDFFGFFGRPGSRVAGTGPGKPGIRTGMRITGPAAGYPAPGPGSRGSGTGLAPRFTGPFNPLQGP